MKRFTIIFSILLVLGFAGALVFVGMSEDFVNPAEATQSGEDMNAPIWTMSMDELLAELESQGLIETTDLVNLAASGLCSVAVKVANGAEIYWWDLENLDENTMEYKSYQQMKEEGVIDIYGSGNIMSLSSNGPFGLLLSLCDGDVDALDKAFKAVGQTGGEQSEVWEKTMDDMLDYLEEKGFLKRDEVVLLSAGTGTKAYGFDGAEIYWWDLDNLEEGSNEAAAYEDMAQEGVIDLWQQGQYFMAVTKNGPFGLATANYKGDADALLDAYTSFGQNGGASADDRSDPVWSKTLDDLADYMVEQGAVNPDERITINYVQDFAGVVSGYRYSDQIDISYYDVDNLVPDTAPYQEYDAIISTGMTTDSSGNVYEFTRNGPFTLHFYMWGKEQVPEEEQAKIIEIFQAFGRE